MELFEENQNKNLKNNKVNKTKNEESSLKVSIGNDSQLIKNELKPTEDNIMGESLEQVKSKKIYPESRKCYQFVGRSLFVFLDKYSNPLFIIGPHWPLFLCLISVLSLFMLHIYLKLWPKLGFKTKLFGSITYWTFAISYTYTSLINPGFPRNTIGRNFGIPKNDYYYCEYCGIYLKKSSYGSHCDECQICIEKHDHHCVWTGHCIGKNNKFTFFIFVISLVCLVFYYAFAYYVGLR